MEPTPPEPREKVLSSITRLQEPSKSGNLPVKDAKRSHARMALMIGISRIQYVRKVRQFPEVQSYH
ncbi:hypothetical protein PENSTE_c015G07763 [Penicillium steckii]|uniref:Uncharacterized protein n=1 Tax=Penicillium steckii TaxID=303698 RepID=A0A1V6T0C4_9EURO|nr:hypothetical protein PENSTE_c015G07763 [Penicillium steckii]